MNEVLITILSGFLSGAILALIGAGSGVIAIVILIYLLKFPIHQAIIIALLNTAVCATAGTVKNYRNKMLDPKIILGIFIPSLIFVPIGSKLSLLIEQNTLEIIYAFLTLVISILMWYNSKKNDILSQEIKVISTNLKRKTLIKYCVIGSLTGFLSGFLGFSGGIIIVPGLVIMLHEAIKRATANSIAIIALTAYLSILSHSAMGNIINYKIALLFSIGGIIGMHSGSSLQTKATNKKIKQSFSIFLMISGIIILCKSLIRLL